MGTDLQGWVEVLWSSKGVGSKWRGVLKAAFVVERNPGLMEALFGIAGEHDFVPLFAERGLPSDFSNEVADSTQIDGITPNASWVLWSELANLDWNRRGQTSTTVGIASGDQWDRMLTDPAYELIEEMPPEETGPGRRILGQIRRRRWDERSGDDEILWLEENIASQTYNLGPIIYRKARWRLEELMSPGWQTLFEVMSVLAKQYGAIGTRLVVWFI